MSDRLKAIQERAEAAQRMSWGVYNVYPYLDDVLSLCSDVRRLTSELHDCRNTLREVADARRLNG